MPQTRSRRAFLKKSTWAAASLSLSGLLHFARADDFDVIIKNGLIADGTGVAPWPADIGISAERIAFIGDLQKVKAARVIDASGRHVCPGFIDIHTHSDGDILAYPRAESRVLQGITTEVTGNCGSSAAPLEGMETEERKSRWLEEDGIVCRWGSVEQYFAQLERNGLALNHALLLGQGTLRRNLIGQVNRELTPDEMKRLLFMVEQGMDQGAFGISTGLEYVPGSFTSTAEIIEMARVVARRNGLYATHMRDEETLVLEAISEALEIGRRSGVRVEISHLKCAGKDNWYKQEAALNLIESARRRGIDVLADAYPYTAYATGLTSFIKPWAREGGTKEILKRLNDATLRKKIRAETEDIVRISPGDYDLIVLSRVKTEKNKELVGKSIARVGEMWQMDGADVLLRLLVEEEGRVGFIGHGMSEKNVDMVLAHPLVMLGSDGSAMGPYGKAAETRPHPRSYGTFPRLLGRYHRQKNLMDLSTAVRKMTSMPADQMGLSDRGRIAKGKKADLVIFNAQSITDRATFDNPHQFPLGIDYVLVNGRIVAEKGRHTGLLPGQVLRMA